jgi:hypothetical protein
MRESVLQCARVFPPSVGEKRTKFSLDKRVHLMRAHIASGERKERKLHHLYICGMSFSDANSLSSRYLSHARCVRRTSSLKWSTFVFFFREKKRLFFRSQRKKYVLRSSLVHAHARAYVSILYISNALINAPDENSCTRAVHTHVRVFSIFFTERILFRSVGSIRSTPEREMRTTTNERERHTLL